MKRRALFALMILLLLSGCGGRGADEFEAWRGGLAARDRINFSADITGGDGETAFTCGVETAYSDGESRVTVTSPETIRGLAFHRTLGEDRLEYDGAILVLPRLGSSSAPCEAAPLFIDALLRGELLYTGREGDTLTAALCAPSGETVTIWRSEDNKNPIYAEIAREGQPCTQLRFSHWD